MALGGEVYDPKVSSKLRMYLLWKKFGTRPSEYRKERAKDISECIEIDSIVEEAVRRESKRREAVYMAAMQQRSMM